MGEGRILVRFSRSRPPSIKDDIVIGKVLVVDGTTVVRETVPTLFEEDS